MKTLKFKCIEGLTFVGDVHGEWKTLAYKATEQYQLENYVIVQLGDFGIGFNSEEYNKVELRKLNTKLKKKNNKLVVLRGNHDDPKYFDGEYSKCYSNIHLVPDYTVLEIFYDRGVPDDGINSTTGFMTVLCIGGGLSVDRTERRKWKLRNPSRNYYWKNEMPVYNKSELDTINSQENFLHQIDIVASHTAPSFVYPYTKDGVQQWIAFDMQLEHDLELERKTMDKIFNEIENEYERLSEWYYGHFHATQTMKVNNINFHLLDICQFREKRLE
jgi:DNA repair exonuclease SbcCD nuclease subunit